MKESYNLIKYKFEMGVYPIDKMIELVKDNQIIEDEFKFITSYNYKGIKEMRD